MSVEVMLKYPSAYLAVACVALAQLLYLLWWGQAFDLALRSTQSTQTGTGAVLLMLLNFIMRHGPFSQSARLQQCREGFEEYIQLAEPHECPLFIDLLPTTQTECDR